MTYDNRWRSADQLPARAITEGIIDELGSLDTTTGGTSSRHSLNVYIEQPNLQLSAYAIDYGMALVSNFTYFLDDPINGDQFEQVDNRWLLGGHARLQHQSQFAGKPLHQEIGVELRYDNIDEVGLYKTRQAQRLGVVRSDSVQELSTSVHWQGEWGWNERLRSLIGLRYDHFAFNVESRVEDNIYDVNLAPNSGTERQGLISLKGNLIYTLNPDWEVYAAFGQGFHSNDARGTTISVDPTDGTVLDKVDPLVQSHGAELGVRGYWGKRANVSLALWQLSLDSELLFVGDAGNTEASRKSRRRGVEVTTYYQLSDRWTLDLEFAYTDASFVDSAPAGDQIPGALKTVWQLGISHNTPNGWFGSLRLRYFGSRPLEESGRVTSDSSTLVNLRAGYR